MTQLDICEWDPSTMSADATILIVGKRHTGKTILTRDIMYNMKDRLDLVFGMNPTEMGNHNLAMFTPPALIFESFDDQKLHEVLEWQRRAVANNKAYKVAFIMDDCMAETVGTGSKKKKVMTSGDINKIFKNGRHLKLFYLNAMQQIKDAPPDIRGNVDILFAFNTNSNFERQKLFNEYFAMFKNYKDFCAVFDACTQGYDCIVLDTRRAATNPSECIFQQRATVRNEPFKVGRPVFWNLSNLLYQDCNDQKMDPSKVLNLPKLNLNSKSKEEEQSPARSNQSPALTVTKIKRDSKYTS